MPWNVEKSWMLMINTYVTTTTTDKCLSSFDPIFLQQKSAEHLWSISKQLVLRMKSHVCSDYGVFF